MSIQVVHPRSREQVPTEKWKTEQRRRSTEQVHEAVAEAVKALAPTILGFGGYSRVSLDKPTRSIIVHLRFTADQVEEYLGDGDEPIDEDTERYFTEAVAPYVQESLRTAWKEQVANDVHLRKRWRIYVSYKPMTAAYIKEIVGYLE